MPLLDWIFVAVLLFSMTLGAWRGLVFEVVSLSSWLAAFVLAQIFASDVSKWLPIAGASELIRYAAGYVLIFVVCVLLGGLLASLAKKLLGRMGMRPADRVLGACFGLVRAGLLLLLATLLAALTPLKDSEDWRQSGGIAFSLLVMDRIKPVMPHDLVKYLPS